MEGAGAHFHVVGLQDHAALLGPEPLQRQDQALERAFRAHMGRQGVHRQILVSRGDLKRAGPYRRGRGESRRWRMVLTVMPRMVAKHRTSRRNLRRILRDRGSIFAIAPE